MSTVGFVGAGRMGGAMVRRLVAAGHEVNVLTRSPEKSTAITELGATPVTDLAAVSTDADAVILCVFTDEQVQDIAATLTPELRAGTVLVIHTTGSPHTAGAIAARGVDVIDAPVSGGPHDIAAGRLTLFVGGSAAAVERARPVLTCYGDPIIHAGPPGAGQRVKLINNALFAAQIGLIGAAVGLGERLGIPESTLLAALPHASSGSRALDGIARAGSTASFRTVVGEFLSKDVATVRTTAAELGTGLGVLDTIIDAGMTPTGGSNTA
ncbi:NAD(P)-dependent oxidoreductase [Mycolicibacterium sp. CBMA 226]|uniref:NAD(P)-dependent oxidoreductase n=1 Tax=Mycolicibacterium sp. CBMA 226 TaxID=2606611 RepID=UPI00130694BA|nr:NAD(P)-dependent oxidoreductase [Mycolicibacterium sp. CBMA 226]MUL75809.1 NAD(P)-dependent oxidoreductase [Mycolicibacterium sp. CBMA 226]